MCHTRCSFFSPHLSTCHPKCLCTLLMVKQHVAWPWLLMVKKHQQSWRFHNILLDLEMKLHFPRGLPKIKRNLGAFKSVQSLSLDELIPQATTMLLHVNTLSAARLSSDDKLRVTLAFGEQRVETNLQLFEPCSLMADCGNLLLYRLKRISDLRWNAHI